MNAAETEARIQRLLSGDVGEPVPGSDFDIVLDALRNARIDVGTLEHLLDSANAELARVNADFDLTASAAARVVAERDALRARLEHVPLGHTRVDVRRDGHALALDLAPHVKVADVAKDVDRAIAEMGRRESVASALRAFDVVTRTGIGTGSGVLDALRTAAVREGLPSAATLPTPDLIAACRAHVRSPASDGFGLGSFGGAL